MNTALMKVKNAKAAHTREKLAEAKNIVQFARAIKISPKRKQAQVVQNQQEKVAAAFVTMSNYLEKQGIDWSAIGPFLKGLPGRAAGAAGDVGAAAGRGMLAHPDLAGAGASGLAGAGLGAGVGALTDRDILLSALTGAGAGAGGYGAAKGMARGIRGLGTMDIGDPMKSGRVLDLARKLQAKLVGSPVMRGAEAVGRFDPTARAAERLAVMRPGKLAPGKVGGPSADAGALRVAGATKRKGEEALTRSQMAEAEEAAMGG